MTDHESIKQAKQSLDSLIGKNWSYIPTDKHNTYLEPWYVTKQGTNFGSKCVVSLYDDEQSYQGTGEMYILEDNTLVLVNEERYGGRRGKEKTTIINNEGKKVLELTTIVTTAMGDEDYNGQIDVKLDTEVKEDGIKYTHRIYKVSECSEFGEVIAYNITEEYYNKEGTLLGSSTKTDDRGYNRIRSL